MCCQFDHERLDVYQVELRFVTWTTDLITQLSESANSRQHRIGSVVDHLERAALSALLNTSEGNGKRQMRTRAQFFDQARGSATECAACLDALVAKGACSHEHVTVGKDMLVRIVSMLTKLIERFSSPDRVREGSSLYDIENEDEIEDEGR
jgi:four helix bundle protein